MKSGEIIDIIVSDFDANIDIKFMLNDRLGEYR